MLIIPEGDFDAVRCPYIRFGDGVGSQGDHLPFLNRQTWLGGIDEIEQPVLLAAVKAIQDCMPGRSVRSGIENQICPLAGGQDHPFLFMGLYGMAIERDDSGAMLRELERKDSGIRSVDKPQPDTLTRPKPKLFPQPPIHGRRVADTAGVRDVLQTAEVRSDRRVPLQPPVVEQPYYVSVHSGRIALLHN